MRRSLQVLILRKDSNSCRELLWSYFNLVLFIQIVLLVNEEDDPDPPVVTKHSKHDVAPICPLKIFPVSIPNVASSCQDSSASIYLGNQAGNIFMVEDLLMGVG